VIVISGLYDDVFKSFRTGSLERELQYVQLSATRSSCIAILWISLVSFAALTLCVASQRVFCWIHHRTGRYTLLRITSNRSETALTSYYTTNCMGQSPFWEDDSRSAGQNSKIHCRVHDSPPMRSIQSQINPIHSLTTYEGVSKRFRTGRRLEWELQMV